MTKNEALDLLKTKFTGIGEAKLVRVAENILKTNGATEEGVTEAIEALSYDDIMERYKDSMVTQGVATAIRNYEEKHGLKNGVRADEVETQAPERHKDGVTDTRKSEETKEDVRTDTPEWAKALIEQNKALKDRLDRIEGEKRRATRKEVLSGITGSLPAEFRKAYDRIVVESMTDEEFATLKDEITDEVSSINKQLKANGAVFTAPLKAEMGTSDTLSKKEAEAFLHAMNLSPKKN